MAPGGLVTAALNANAQMLAYTYSEPLIHAEYILDCMALARAHGIANVLVTNGHALAEAACEILSLTDAANIDLKSFSEDTYSKILGGNLEAVLAFIRLAVEKNVHTEITTLVVPGLNDSAEELEKCASFISSLDVGHGRTPPWHLSAYHPSHRWNAPPTDPGFLLLAAERARKILPNVYTGNIPGGKNNTHCLCCGNVLVARQGYSVNTDGLGPSDGGFYRCARCGEATAIAC
jgi:pyruvate formate lyase activating enzyme